MTTSIMSAIRMVIPIYGDFYIHRFFSEERKKSKEKLKWLIEEGGKLETRENNFKKELSDLMRKYRIKEEMGSPISFPSEYIAQEKSNLPDLWIGPTIIPEIIIYGVKYSSIICLGKLLLNRLSS